MYTKKAQVTIFMILGLVLLLSMGVFLYYVTKTEQQRTIPEDIDKTTITVYVEECLTATAEAVIQKIAAQGGMYKPVFYKTYNGQNISYWCLGEGEEQCANSLFLKEDFAEQIIEGIKEEYTSCINFQLFEEQGYDVSEGIFKGTAIIADDAVDLMISYPVKLKKENEQVTVENFHIKVESNIGVLYDISRSIINSEATKGSFDVMDYLLNHTNLEIIKNRSYPGIIYAIKERNSNLILHIAIHGIDSAATPGEILLANTEQAYGCCYAGIENVCYANTPSTVCIQKDGKYETAPCNCPEAVTTKKTSCDDGQCDPCGTKKHGESWCVYEAETGNGKDPVGSRHALQYCFDGEIYQEACRDYREEICIQGQGENNGKLVSKATCRPNRWQDCYVCATIGCCENTEQRDCYWNENLDEITKTQCTPYVPPGLKFWDFNGLEICSRGNAEKTCNGLYCSQDWVNNAAMFCYSQGDCGNYRNTEGILTESGFFISNYKYDPEEEIYAVDNEATAITTLPLTVRQQTRLLNAPVAEAADIFTEMLTAAYRFVNNWVDVTVPNYLNPFTKKPKIEILELSWCSVWQAPKTEVKCEMCTDAVGCSEYKCKSLGRKCVYEEKNGYAVCYEAPQEEQKQFTARVVTEKLQSSYSLEQKNLSIDKKVYSGYTVTQPLKPYTIFSLPLETTTDTVCRLDYTPLAEYLDPPAFIIGAPEYAQEHVIMARVPPQMNIPQQLKEGLNLTTAEQIVTAVTKPKDLLESYEEKFPAVFDTYKFVTGNDLADELRPHVDKILSLIDDIEEDYPYYKNMSITLLEKFDSSGYYLFVSCEDIYGNTQENEIFIEIGVANITEDTSPPIIVATNPESDSIIAADATIVQLSVYTDEPADCHYDIEDISYEEMEYALSCKNEIYNRVSVAGGSYLCSTTLPIEEEVRVYMRCADNPRNKKSYRIALQLSNQSGVASTLYSEAIPEETENPLEVYANYINIADNEETSTTTIAVSAYLLSDTDATLFNVSKENVTIQLYIDEEQKCTLDNETESIGMPCFSTEQVEENKGLYTCISTVVLQNSLLEESNETTTIMQQYTINCRTKETEQNIMVEALGYVVTKGPALEITEINPGDNQEVAETALITVTTSKSEDVQCGYAEYGSIEYNAMKKISTTGFTAVLEDLKVGYVAYTFYCSDKIGNTATRTISLYVMDE